MNNVALTGRLTKDATIAYSNGAEAKAIGKFTLAVDRMRKGEADFINCVAFGKTAEVIEKYTSKGSKIAVSGRIQTGSYQKQDGTKVYTTDVIVNDVEFLDKKEDTTPLKNSTPQEEFYKVEDEGIPFN